VTASAPASRVTEKSARWEGRRRQAARDLACVPDPWHGDSGQYGDDDARRDQGDDRGIRRQPRTAQQPEDRQGGRTGQGGAELDRAELGQPSSVMVGGIRTSVTSRDTGGHAEALGSLTIEEPGALELV
jgi:hypothetical protein